MAMNDHDLFLHEFGISEELERAVMSYTGDLDLAEIDGVKLGRSEIHGKGTFATKQFKSPYCVGWSVSHNQRTILGRYMNHSPQPNCIPVRASDGMLVIAINDVCEGDELLINYRDVMYARD